jgi:DNA-binding NtrC family response regulator
MTVEYQRDEPETGQPETGEPDAGTGHGQPSAGPGNRADSAGSAGRKARILIVEDEAWDAELAQRLLTSAGLGFTAVVVATRESFVEQLAAFRPDIILSDFHLPGFSGEAALRIAQEQCPDTPFVFWSGVLGDERAVELIKQGATDYVLKDRPARLPSVIHRALAEAEQRTQLAQLEDQLSRAQRLASLGQLAAAEEAMSVTRQLLAIARRGVTAADPRP